MFDQIMDRVAGRFRRVEPRATARAYLLGLLSGVERKNCWRLAEQAGLARPGPMQRLLRNARWDADAVRDDVRAYVVDHLGSEGGVLIVDETGFVRKGSGSAGVQRQYTGTAGRIENSQVRVFLAYATRKGRALIDRRLYLPEHSWCCDTQRRDAAGIPDEVQFATKPRLAWQMIDDALDAGVTASWVTGDDAGSSRIPSRLAHRARPIRQCWADPTLSRLLSPSPAIPGSGCPQLHLAATTAKRRWSSTSVRNNSASWRTDTVLTGTPGRAPGSTEPSAVHLRSSGGEPEESQVQMAGGLCSPRERRWTSVGVHTDFLSCVRMNEAR
ncbi:IS701 family transposase [Streptomyces flaveus]|uniref:IS701 family transposase n=1 Tax=Streptomyces flaveus TaxID=66370 RepID=UPI00332CC6A3